MEAALVVEASAIADLIMPTELAAGVRERLEGSQLHAPAHADAEVGAILERLRDAGRLTTEEVEERLARLAEAPIERHPLAPLIAGRRAPHRGPLSWTLYLELAARLGGATVITTDVGLAEETVGRTSTAGLDGDLPPGDYYTAGLAPDNVSFSVRPARRGEMGWRGDLSREENQRIAASAGLDPDEFTGDTRWSIAAERADLPYLEFVRRIDAERLVSSWGVTLLGEPSPQPVEALVEALRVDPRLEATADPEPITVGGAPGLMIDGLVTASPEASPFPPVTHTEGQMVRWILVQVEGATRVIGIEAPPEDVERFLPEALELLETLRWLRPPYTVGAG